MIYMFYIILLNMKYKLFLLKKHQMNAFYKIKANKTLANDNNFI